MYKKIWFKIHLYLGLTAGIILAIIGLTGSILSFEKEIITLYNKDSLVVKVEEFKYSEKEILKDFQSKFPNEKIRKLTIFSDKNSSYIINIASNKKGKEGRKGINYYVNPYNLEILPQIEGKEFFKFIENIHRRLTFGEIGKQIVGASVLSLLLILFSGIYIYFPKMKKNLLKSITFNFKSFGRAFLSKIHTAIGVWITPFILLAALTGLFWSYSWYKDGFYKILQVEKSSKKRFIQDSNVKTDLENVQIAINIFKKEIYNFDKASINLNTDEKNIYTINYLKTNPIHFRANNEILIDINKNKILEHKEFSKLPLNQQILKSIYPLHTGEYFGRVGQILMFLSSLFLTLVCVIGIIIYIKRKY